MFARKLVRPSWRFTLEEVQNEARAVAKLCKPGSHDNIVSVLRQGLLPKSSYHFLDMELCDFSLETYIHRQWTPIMADKIPYFTTIDEQEPATKFSQILNIMRDITSGVAFIHLQKEIHRDLKPRNGRAKTMRRYLTML